MLLSELIAKLEELRAEHGDLPVALYDGHIGKWYRLQHASFASLTVARVPDTHCVALD